MRESNQHSWIVRGAILLFLLGSAGWGLYLTSPPSPKPASSTTGFSAERAMQDVRQIAEMPHMVGTAEHDSVKEYLLGRLRQLGLNPQVEMGISTIERGNSLRAVQVQNIIARMEGTGSGRTILLMAHYDSVPYAQGAADDAAGVGAILEVVRAVQAGSPLQNDIIILFTDAEEGGLMGARYFAEHNPLMDEIDLLLNFEARGTSGSSIMFETNDGNDKLIPLFEKATPNPVANSLTYSVYKVLPNDTDFTIFKQHGIQGLNFAFIEDYLDYHTMQDNPKNLSLSSLQHHGENLLANLRLFGNSNFDISAQTDVIYFNSPFGGITYYPVSWSYYLVGFVLLLFIYFLVSSYRKGRISLLRTGLSFITFTLLLILGGLFSWYGWKFAVNTIFPQYQWLQHGETYAHSWYLSLFLLVAATLGTIILRWITSKININNLLGGIYLIWFILVIGLTAYLPAASYLLLWPAFFGFIGWAFTTDQLVKDETIDILSIILLGLSLFTVLFMFPFYIKLIQVALTSEMLGVSVILFLMMFGLIWPLFRVVIGGYQRSFYGVMAGAMLFCIVGIVWNAGYSETEKRQNSLIYAADLNNKRAYWLSVDHKTDEWTANFLGDNPADSSFAGFEIIGPENNLYSSAIFIPINPPIVELIEIQNFDSLKKYTVQITPTYPSVSTSISLMNSNEILELSTDGKIIYRNIQPDVNHEDSIFNLNYFKPFNQPFNLSFSVRPNTNSVRLKLVSHNLSYPDSLMANHPPRPDDAMPKPGGFTNGTIWQKTVSIDSLSTLQSPQPSQ